MSLIIHPEIEKRKNKLSDLIYEHDYLINHYGPYLEHKYVSLFGFNEYVMYELELRINMLKRKIQLIRIQINNEEEIDLDEIESAINKEFTEHLKQIEAQLDELNFVKGKKFNKLSKSEAKEIKESYRKIIKKLHPDLNPNQSIHDRHLFIQATEAFNKQNLDKLKSILFLADEETTDTCEINELDEMIEKIEDEIGKIKEEYPFNKEDLLNSDESIKEYKEMLLSLIDDRKETVIRLEKVIEDLI